MTTKTLPSGTGVVSSYSYDAADRLTSVDPPSASPVTYTWDDNGSLTDRGSDTFAWDYDDVYRLRIPDLRPGRGR